MAKLGFGVVVYLIWNERNNKIFSQKSKDIVALIMEIKTIVRARTSSMKFHYIDVKEEIIIRKGNLS